MTNFLLFFIFRYIGLSLHRINFINTNKFSMNTKIFLLYFSVILLAFTSCSSDDDEKDILGSWRYTQGNVNVIVETNTAAFTPLLLAYFSEEAEDSEHIMVFKGDGIMMMKYGEEIDFEAPYEFKNGILKIAGIHYAKASINKNVLTIEKDVIDDYNSQVLIDAIFLNNAEVLTGVDKANVKITKMVEIIKYTR